METWRPRSERDNTEEDVEPLNNEGINCSDVTFRFGPQADHVRVINDLTALEISGLGIDPYRTLKLTLTLIRHSAGDPWVRDCVVLYSIVPRTTEQDLDTNTGGR